MGELFKATLERGMDVKLTEHLGYDRHERRPEGISNARNGTTPKTLATEVGQQTRAVIHLQDTVRCIQLALDNPPALGDRVAIFNQMTETHRIRDLARLIADRTGATVTNVPNPA